MKNVLRLSEPQNHRCCYCGHRMIRHRHKNGVTTPPDAITRDHLIPRAIGGTNENLVAACSTCNLARGDMDALAFFTRLQRIFNRTPGLHERWHSLEPGEFQEIRRALLDTHERHLRGLGIRSIQHAWRHFKLIQNYGHELRA